MGALRRSDLVMAIFGGGKLGHWIKQTMIIQKP